MAPDKIDCSLLLPQSGVGVIAPWLVIAPPATDQVIRLDLRLLDRIEIIDPAEWPDELHKEEATSVSAKSQSSDVVDLSCLPPRACMLRQRANAHCTRARHVRARRIAAVQRTCAVVAT
jgi:hypothetical protein